MVNVALLWTARLSICGMKLTSSPWTKGNTRLHMRLYTLLAVQCTKQMEGEPMIETKTAWAAGGVLTDMH